MASSISVFEKVYALWLREFKVFLRERSRLVASTFTPLLWLFVIGIGFGSVATLTSEGGVGYQKFIFPGIVCMSVIFTSVFFGSYVIWDRKFDFLKSVMVAPVSRGTIFVGKALGGMTSSLLQAAILLFVGAIIGMPYTPYGIVEAIVIVLLLSFALTSLGLAIGSYMQSLEGFQLIVSFVVFPLFFLSGALFPLENLPPWLSILTSFDPATYGVSAMRSAVLGVGSRPFPLDTLLLLVYAIALGTAGIYSFKRMKAV
ncbi:MAG: ABC transporter permease [Thaumarchaeota archaeon]|nr:ABC transporter permease [Nitrososphaerota archaeon]